MKSKKKKIKTKIYRPLHKEGIENLPSLKTLPKFYQKSRQSSFWEAINSNCLINICKTGLVYFTSTKNKVISKGN